MSAESAEIIYVGKESGYHSSPQSEINKILVRKAREGKNVIRLKGGDPFVFGRGGEEAIYLAKNGIPFEIIPGITAGIAVPAYAGIPLTHRNWTSSVAFITGHKSSGSDSTIPDWGKIGSSVDTIVIYMAFKNLKPIIKEIRESGRSAETPVAAIHRGTTQHQKTVSGNLENIADLVEKAGLEPPIIHVIGEVVKLRKSIQWFEP